MLQGFSIIFLRWIPKIILATYIAYALLSYLYTKKQAKLFCKGGALPLKLFLILVYYSPFKQIIMNEVFFKLKNNAGLALILLIGLGVEFSNFQSMFFRFMTQYRPDWGAINHIPAGFLSAFLLLCIVIFGIRKQVITSWFLAMLTCVVSFAVYSRLNLVWKWEQMHEIHFVVLILSIMLPMLVAYTTHQITNDQETDFYAQEMKYRRVLANATKPQRYYSRNHVMQAEKIKTHKPIAKPKNSQTKTNKKPPIIIDEYEENEEQEEDKEILAEEIFWQKNKKHTPNPKAPNQKICEHCLIEFTSNNKYAKFCSENCRLIALRRKNRTNFYTSKDNFDTDGSMEWVNPKNK